MFSHKKFIDQSPKSIYQCVTNAIASFLHLMPKSKLEKTFRKSDEALKYAEELIKETDALHQKIDESLKLLTS